MNVRPAVLAVLLLSTGALAQSVEPERHPIYGTVYSLQEKAILEFECQLDTSDRLQCDFVQTNITQSPDLEQTRKSNIELLQQFESGKNPFGEEECADLRKVREGLESPEMQARSPGEIEVATAYVEAFEGVCAMQTIESVRRMTDLTESVEARTCRVRSQTFEQTFKETSPGNWVNVAEPHGPCGIVRLDRFQRSDPASKMSLTFWNYYSEKIITTPGGSENGVIECSALDEKTYEYVWQSRSHVMDCHYIKFGWF